MVAHLKICPKLLRQNTFQVVQSRRLIQNDGADNISQELTSLEPEDAPVPSWLDKCSVDKENSIGELIDGTCHT